ncbi:hypothetical protein KIW84_031861 [Lathyrus oleraceus]|uniref:Helicase ATP-binding domain-containing protein n=1 Tax=Pisum sativum TaxID=3888 RepID=A0A9D4XW02_PEA|nr:hypothetical protein KIW84_031861 [Pisum sativum]
MPLTAALDVTYFDRILLTFHFQKDKPWMIQLVAVTCISLDEGPSPIDSRHLNRPQTCRIPNLTNLQRKEMKVKHVNLTKQSYAGKNTESIEEGAVDIMQVTLVTAREKELHLQVIQLQQSIGSLVDELRRQKMKNVRLERQLSTVEIMEGAPMEQYKTTSEDSSQAAFNVVVTTYEFIMYDRAKLSKIDWKYIVVDEAQRMKNRDSVLARDLNRYRCQRRMLLTGTPLQNDLKELWSLLNLLLPEVLITRKPFMIGSQNHFKKESYSQQLQAQDLHNPNHNSH